MREDGSAVSKGSSLQNFDDGLQGGIFLMSGVEMSCVKANQETFDYDDITATSYRTCAFCKPRKQSNNKNGCYIFSGWSLKTKLTPHSASMLLLNTHTVDYIRQIINAPLHRWRTTIGRIM